MHLLMISMSVVTLFQQPVAMVFQETALWLVSSAITTTTLYTYQLYTYVIKFKLNKQLAISVAT